MHAELHKGVAVRTHNVQQISDIPAPREYIASRRNNTAGTIVAHIPALGRRFYVKHPDGSVAIYDFLEVTRVS